MPEHPSRRRLYLLALGIAIVLIIGFALSAPHLRDAKLAQLDTAEQATPTVYLHDVFKKGTHTITGQIAVPDACTNASAEAELEGSSTIAIALSLPSDSGTCLMLPATTTFSLSIAAPAGSAFTASINGNDASTTRY